jgi:tetratricopeptide (TPR) repeat protein
MKMKPVLFLLFFLIIPATGFAQVGHLRGVVTDPAGTPLKGAQIEITGMDIKRKYKVKTNKHGKYVHVGVATGSIYRIVVTKEGYQRDYTEGAKATWDPLNEKLGRYDFELQPLQQGRTERQLSYELSDEERAKLAKMKAEQEKKAAASEELVEKFDQARQDVEAGNFEQAVQLLTEAAEIDATQAGVWVSLALAQTGLENHEEALSAYQKAAMLQPSPAIYQNMGNAYAAMGNKEKAQESYTKAVEMSAGVDPSAAAATYFNMAVGHINSQETQKATEALHKAIEADPGYAEAYYQLGIILSGDMKAILQAVEHLKKYLELAPEGPNAEMARLLVEGLSG